MTDLVPAPDSALLIEDLALDELDAGDGAPPTRFRELGGLFDGEAGGVSYGVWEMEPGVADDVEAEEVFIVLSGVGTIALLDAGEEIPLGPGSLVRLAAGTRTRWTVTSTLRKLYLSP